MVRREKTNYVIQSVAHALDVLEQFHADLDELGVTELSRRLKLHKNNVFRLLATLESRGYIEQNKTTENYRLGLRCLQLGQTFVEQMGLLRQAEPILEEVVREGDENAFVAVLRHRAAVPVRVLESSRPVRIVSPIGEPLPLHATAAGKALLAYESEEERANLVGASPDRHTARTITALEPLFDHLATVAEKGWASEKGEHIDDVCAVAAPVRDYTRSVVGSLTVAGPAYRMDDARIEASLAPLVVRAARDLSARLGFND